MHSAAAVVCAMGVFLGVMLPATNAFAKPPAGSKWRVTFEDEFERARLDTTKWTVREGPRRDGFWDGRGVRVRGDGSLRLATFVEDGVARSGSIDTRGRFEQTYGYFEARCSMPRAQGHWSAFWLFTREFGKTDSAALSGAEVDIFEYHTLLGREINMAVHWPRYGPDLRTVKRRHPLPEGNGMVTFGLLWEADRYVFFVEDSPVWEVREGVSARPLFLLLSNEVGPWAGPLQASKFPDEMVCDYVRVYERVQD